MSENPLLEMPDNLAAEPIPMGVAVGALALNFAMKFYDINTVQDGTLYQQYKLEGKNMEPLHLDMVFEMAKQIEAHLMTTPNRLSSMICDAAAEILLAEEAQDEG